jgi:hypothetical protein
MDSDGGFERWGGDIDFNDWSPPTQAQVDEGPRWEPTPPSRWGARRIALVLGGALVATLIGVGGVLAVVNLAGGDDPEAGAGDAQGALGPDADAPIVALPADLEWYAVDGTLGFVNRIAGASDGSFYALSTAPGRNFDWPPTQAIYHTVDGEAWDFAILADDIGSSDMAVLGDTLYLIGTAPGFGGSGDAPAVVVSASSDAGVTWDQQSLPIEAQPPVGAGDVGWTESSMHVAASSSGLVAVVQTNFWVDFRRLVPPEALGDGSDVQPTETGVNVIDYSLFEQLQRECDEAGGFRDDLDVEEMPEPCRQLFTGDIEGAVVATFTWEELGLEGGQPVFSEVFFSEDGETWEPVASPFRAGRTLASLHATSQGFIGTQWGDVGGHEVWVSPDGRTWEAAEGLPAFDWIVGAGTVGGRDVILGSALGHAVAAWSDGFGAWQEVDVATAIDAPIAGQTWMSAGAVGPLGVVAVLQSDGGAGNAGGPGLIHGTGPEDWAWVPLDGLISQQFGFSDWVAVGRDQILARFVESGAQQPVNLQLIGLPG